MQDFQGADAGGAVGRELDRSSDAGIHRVAWDLRKPAPPQEASDPPPLECFLANKPVGPRIEPRNYVVRLLVNGRTITAPLRVEADPNRR